LIEKLKMIIIKPNHVHLLGVNLGGAGKIIAWNDKYVVVKWPSSRESRKTRSILFGEPVHYPPKTTVLRILGRYTKRTMCIGGVLTVKWVIGWDNTRKERS